MIATAPAAPKAEQQTGVRVRFPEWRGAARALMFAREREVVLDGPAGTGKSYAALWKVHVLLLMHPGLRALVARKTLISLKRSTLVTYKEKVAKAWMDAQHVRFWAARADEPAHYAYPRESKLVIAGLDKPGKAMSTEYDLVLVDEALDTELEDWETLLTRTGRPGSASTLGYSQLLGVTNPGPPSHWLNQRMNAGTARRLLSHHDDNPAMTREYLAVLGALTGVRRKRLLLGEWSQAEGAVYEDAWDTARNLVPRAKLSRAPDKTTGDAGIDPTWPRYLGIDWGYRNPLSLKWYARQPDGELLVYRELYETMRLVEDVAREALQLMGWRMSPEGALLPTRADADPLPRAIIADHDAEDRATFERHFGLNVTPADKGKDSIRDGIQAVTKRLQEGRLRYLEGALVRRDPMLSEAKRPCSSVEEFDSYVWDLRAGRPAKDVPVDEDNHGMDTDRYVVQYFDRSPADASYIPFHATGY